VQTVTVASPLVDTGTAADPILGLYLGDGTGTVAGIGFGAVPGTGFSRDVAGGGEIAVLIAAVPTCVLRQAGLAILQQVSTGGSPIALSVTGAALLGLANAELRDVDLALARTITWAAGAKIPTQRAVLIGAQTLAGSGGVQDFGTAATLAISGAPALGAGATADDVYAFWIQGGRSKIEGPWGLADGDVTDPGLCWYAEEGLGLYRSGRTINIAAGGVKIGAIGDTSWQILQAIATASAPNALKITAGLHTNVTAGADLNDVLIDLSRGGSAVQFATGGITATRAVYVKAPTYTAIGASVAATLATLAINGAPTVSGPLTATNLYALHIEAGATRLDGGLQSNGSTNLLGQLRLTGSITPTPLSANVDNYNPSGLGSCSVILLSQDIARSITGLVSSGSGQTLYLYNISAANMTLVHESGSSTAARRFSCTGAVDFIIPTLGRAMLWYDGSASRWRVS